MCIRRIGLTGRTHEIGEVKDSSWESGKLLDLQTLDENVLVEIDYLINLIHGIFLNEVYNMSLNTVDGMRLPKVVPAGVAFPGRF